MDDARFDRVPSDSPLVNLVLRAYCLALVKACDFVHLRVATEYYYEVCGLAPELVLWLSLISSAN